MCLTTEFMSIDSENTLFKQVTSNENSYLIEQSQFNKNLRKLFLFSEEIRTKLASIFLDFEDCFIFDSMPIEIGKFSPHNRVKICKDEFETKSKLILITGHSIMTALEKYLRDIDAELPEDYSNLLR